MSDEAALRGELCRVGASLFARGHVHGTTGNLSARLDDGFLITATDACLGALEPGHLAKVDPAGRPLDGARPSKTLALHRRIYEADREAGCVIHTHSSHAVRLSLRASGPSEDFIPPITPYFVMKVGHVPLIGYHRPGHPEVADRVAEAIAIARTRGAPIRAVMIARLGPNVWHDTPAAACAVLEELEETARLWLEAVPRPVPLGEAQIDELRAHFDAHW